MVFIVCHRRRQVELLAHDRQGVDQLAGRVRTEQASCAAGKLPIDPRCQSQFGDRAVVYEDAGVLEQAFGMEGKG